MSEETLKLLSIDDICAIMIKTIEEYRIMEKLNANESQLEEKRADIYVLYKLINAKKNQAADSKY